MRKVFFDIVRPFEILGVECDVKRFHIAFVMPKISFYWPNPRLFSMSNLVEFQLNLVVFDFFQYLSNRVEFLQTPCETLVLQAATDLHMHLILDTRPPVLASWRLVMTVGCE